jgi:hypothetical protein
MSHVIRDLRGPWMAVLCLLGGLAASSAGAQADCLEPAVAAQTNIDYEASLRIAMACIEQGTLDRESLVRAYALLGTGHGALGQAEEARQAFGAVLALDPGFSLGRGVSPTIRRPFYEASEGARPLAMDASDILFGEGTLRIRLRGPLSLVGQVRVFWRPYDSGPFEQVELAPAPSTDTRLAGTTRGVQAYVQVVDAHGNLLLQRGEDLMPLTLGVVTPVPVPEEPPPPEDPVGHHITAIGLTVLALTAIGAGVAFTVIGNDAAGQLRDAEAFFREPGNLRFEGCENAFDPSRGRDTLETLCPGLSNDATLFQPLGAVSFVLGGILAAAAGIALALAPSAPEEEVDEAGEGGAEARLLCGPGGPGDVGAACLLRF